MTSSWQKARNGVGSTPLIHAAAFGYLEINASESGDESFEEAEQNAAVENVEKADEDVDGLEYDALTVDVDENAKENADDHNAQDIVFSGRTALIAAGTTALMIASNNGYNKIIEQLLHGANIDVQNKSWRLWATCDLSLAT